VFWNLVRLPSKDRRTGAPFSKQKTSDDVSPGMMMMMPIQRLFLPLSVAVLAIAIVSTARIHAFLILLPSPAPLSLSSRAAQPYTVMMMMSDGRKKTNNNSTGGTVRGGFGKKVTTNNINVRTKTSSSSRPRNNENNNTNNFVYAGTIRPHEQSPMRIVDPGTVVSLPDYATDGIPKKRNASSSGIIEIKSPQDILKMRAAGKVARQVLDIAGSLIASSQPAGCIITTDEIDAVVHAACIERRAYPSPLNYRKFPKSCCTSVNEVICHGIPDSRPLQYGDIINIDITCYLDGYHGDCSEMFVVGGKEALDDDGKKLLQTTYDCWIKSMELVKPGVNYNVIGRCIEEYIVPRGYSTVKSFCGHGIGQVFHMAPNIYHYTVNQPLDTIQAGHVFTIEPMICEGLGDPYMWQDNWTATTVDGKRSAQFEHTLLVTPDGVEALTGKLEGSPLQFWEEESSVRKGFWLGTSADARRRADELNGR
jgi:methionyl aminopeptidase